VLCCDETAKKSKKIPRKCGSDITVSWNEYTWTDTAKSWASTLQTEFNFNLHALACLTWAIF